MKILNLHDQLNYEFDEHGFNIVLDTINYCNIHNEIETDEPGSPIGWIRKYLLFEPVELRVQVYNLDKIRSLK